MGIFNFNAGQVIIFIILFLFRPFLGYSQETCHPSGDRDLAPSTDGWIGHVYQLPVGENPNAESFMATGQYKGVLRAEYLHPNSVNFETDFGNYGAPSNDEQYADITEEGCSTRLSYFGVVFKGRYTLPAIGTYKITVNSDDGARLYINGTAVHDRWIRQDYLPGNARSYYVTQLAGFVLNMELRYYELSIYNKVGFTIERYYGPGVIAGDQRISSINPDPVAFTSLAPAEFPNRNLPITYKWYYNTSNNPDPSTWTPLPNSDSEVYDIPAYIGSTDQFQGVRYYHRRATSGGIDYISNALKVELCKVENIDQTPFGDKEWIGYVYSGYVASFEGGFDAADFLGRVKEPPVFSQGFGGDQKYYPTLDGGCEFFTDKFSIRYKMKIWVDPGTYNYEIVGDDGFRLIIQDGQGNYLGTDDDLPGNYAIYNWTTGGAVDNRKREIKNDLAIDRGMYLYFTLEYFENIYGNSISFNYSGDPFSILPLEWGEVAAEACGPANCLTWETIQEQNTSHFELERSYNGKDWEMFDHSVRAQGYSTQKKVYQFADTQFMSSKVYYRIRQIDLDGAFAYSDVMRVDNSHYVKSYLPFPNPTMDKIRFYSPTEVVHVSLVNSDYLLNYSLKPKKMPDNRYEVDLVGLKPGNYVVIVQTSDGGKDIFKVIKK